MRDLETEKAETIVLRLIEQSPRPITPGELLEQGSRPNTDVSSAAVHRALWNLVDAGAIEFTPNRQLTVPRGPRVAGAR